MSRPGANASHQSHLHVQITQTKQKISNCQNQIAVQQALYMKHQQAPQQQHQPSPAQPSVDFMRSNSNDINPLSEFRDLSHKDQQQLAQSRFKTSWELPSFEKDDADLFSRAPGSKSRSDIWSGLNEETGLTSWSDGDMFKESVQPLSAQQSGTATPAYLADLMPEFEPGKPWKGSQMKNIEDDPHVTPGSVNRSPLSVNTIFNNWPSKVNPTDSDATVSGRNNSAVDPLTSLSLSSNTWAFPAASSSSFVGTDTITSIHKTPTSSSWDQATTDSLWSGTASVSKPRGPPPGLSQ